MKTVKKAKTADDIKLLTELQKQQKLLDAQITCKLEIITSEKARGFLLSNLNNENVKNRKINGHTVDRYVNDILNGRWKISESIKFDTANNMIDGQQRCTAIYKAGKPVLSFVMRGFPTDSFDVFDIGKKRTIGDIVSMMAKNNEKLKNPTAVGSAVVIANNLENNVVHVEKNWILSNPEVKEIIMADFDYYNEPFKSKKIDVWRKNIKGAIPSSHLAAFYYKYKRTHNDMVNRFLDVLTSNDSSTPEIIRKFRDNVLENKGRGKYDKKFMTPTQVLSLICILFKYYQQKGGLHGRKDFAKKDLQEIFG
jgi:hypothetical protein